MKKIDPVAYARKWHIDKEEPYKIRREKDNRLVWHAKFRFMPVTNGRIFPDDCALYTREAIDEAVKTVFGKIGAELIHDLTDDGFEKLRNIDLDAIINQLTGE